MRTLARGLVVLIALLAAPAAASADGPVPYDISGCFPAETATLCVEDHGALKLTTTPSGILVATAAGTSCVDVFVAGTLTTSLCEDYRSVNVVADGDQSGQVLHYRRIGTQVTIDPGTGEPALSCTYAFNVAIAGGDTRHEAIELVCG
jgi:archaellum component FlaG (FlaF/FlaG flagellin family)